MISIGGIMSYQDYLYEGLLEEKSIILYKAESPLFDQALIIDNYLQAAEIIIKHICNTLEDQDQTSSIHDQFALPLLNIYIHAIEFSLKALLNKLIVHSSNSNCGFKINEDNLKKSKSALKTHYIDELISTIDKVLPRKSELHYINEYDKIKKCFLELYNAGVNSFSTRYSADREGLKYELHSKQINIRIVKVHEDVEKYCRIILDYINPDFGEDFYECEQGEYTYSRLHELKKTNEILMKHLKLYENAKASRKSELVPGNFRVITVSDISLDSLRPTNEEILLMQSLKTMDVEELWYVVLGLYFTWPISSIPSLENIKLRERRALEEKAYERKGIYENALKGLKKQIDKAEKKINTIKTKK